MTTKNHTPIATGAAANAATINTPLGALDAAIGDRTELATTAKDSLVAALNELDQTKQDILANQTANTVYAGPTSGEVQPPAFRMLVSSDLPASGVTPGTYPKVTVDAKGRVISGQNTIGNDDIAANAGIAWNKLDKTGAQAAEIAYLPVGGIDATTVQSAIEELNTEKAPMNHTHDASGIVDITSVKLDDFTAPDDNTDLDATISRHGLFPKLANDALKVINGIGSWIKLASNIKVNGALAGARSYLDIRGTGVTYYDDVTNDAVRITITGGGSGGGASVLNDLTDVTSTGESDKDILTYNAVVPEWENKPQSTFKLDDFGTPDDNSDLNATTGRHGLMPKLSGNTSDVLRGDGTFGTQAGGGHIVQNEGANVTNRPTLNFTGSDVNVSDDAANNQTIVKVSVNMIQLQVFS